MAAAVVQAFDASAGDQDSPETIRHAETPELAREALQDSALLIFKAQVRSWVGACARMAAGVCAGVCVCLIRGCCCAGTCGAGHELQGHEA